ncbi:hypothetical protein HYZ99_03015 [Candidatus Peregrinibacteria bacterium]|nr:hypothetical protein [Candidatus Peregrinibacteria bacterium]
MITKFVRIARGRRSSKESRANGDGHPTIKRLEERIIIQNGKNGLRIVMDLEGKPAQLQFEDGTVTSVGSSRLQE